MPLPSRLLWIATLSLLGTVALEAGPVENAIAKSAKQPLQAGIQTLMEADRQMPGQPELLAHLSFSWAEESTAARKRKEKEPARAAAEKAVYYAKKAIDAEPQSAKAHLALSIAYGRQTDFVDNSTKMSLSKVIRAEAERSIALDPTNPVPYEILGRWKYGFATLNPILRMAAKMAYGTLPNPTLEDAEKDLLKSVSLNPKRISPYRQLAILYKSKKEPAKATEAWKKILTLTPEDDDEKSYLAEAREALK